MKKILTVFTPSYNRAYTLHKCYESLKKQSSQNFTWLIIDDGSTDNTKELVEKWIKESNLDIRYHYQKNQGMHGAHNTAYKLIDTELNVCIDSDDYMPENAVEKIISFWNKNKRDDLAGIIALDAYGDGNIIGEKFPKDIKETTLFEVNNIHKIPGDKKLVYRTELTKDYPYPLFEGEKYVGLAYKYYKIDEKYKLATLNEVVCIVEYLEDGSSMNMLNQYRRNPRGFAFYRIENIKNSRAGFKFKLKESVHYVSSSLLANNRNLLKETPNKALTIVAMPLGIALYSYIRMKTSEAK